jgi:hypothetical protein
LVKLVVIKLHQTFKSGKGEFADAVQVVVILVIHHVGQVVDYVVQLLQAPSVVPVLKQGLTASLLKPNTLVVVHGGFVSTIFKKDFYDLLPTIYIA